MPKVKYRVGSLLEVVDSGETLEIVKIHKRNGNKIAEMRNVDGSDDVKDYWQKPWDGTARLNEYINKGLVKVLSY